MFWDYFRLYVYASIAIGFFSTLRMLWSKRSEILQDKIDPKTTDSGLQEAVEAGRVQREEYGERVVYHGVDGRGKIEVQGLDATNNLKKNHKLIYTTLVFVVGWIDMSITWPLRFITWLRSSAR